MSWRFGRSEGYGRIDRPGLPQRNAGRGIPQSHRDEQIRLAKSIGVPAQRIGDIIACKRGISADTDLRLCRFFGLSDGWWLKLQAGHDTVMAKRGMAAELERIVPLVRAA
jgi:antitoxin HigA-1